MMSPYRDRAVNNLKKAHGQIARVIAMIEEDKYCMDVAQQVNAAIGLLKKVDTCILESHLITCSPKMLRGGRKAEKRFVDEILRVCTVTNRS